MLLSDTEKASYWEKPCKHDCHFDKETLIRYAGQTPSC